MDCAALVRIIFLLVGIGFYSTCKEFRTNRTKGPNDSNANPEKVVLIKRDNVRIARSENGHQIDIQMATTEATHCRITFWPIGQKDFDNPEGRLPCGDEAMKATYAFTFDIEHPQVTYGVAIRVWVGDESASPYDEHRHEEQQSDIEAFFNPFQYVVYTRFNNPQHVAEAHIHKLATRSDKENLKEAFSDPSGCEWKIPTRVETFDAEDPDRSIAITTRGFAAATSHNHPQFEKRQQLTFDGEYHRGDLWEWSFVIDQQNGGFISRRSSELLDVEITGQSKVILRAQELQDEPPQVSLVESEPLRLSWAYRDLPEQSHLNVTIGTFGQQEKVICSFNSLQGSGEVPWDLLKNLEPGGHEIEVRLESYQILAVPKFKDLAWVIASFDWRRAKGVRP